MAFSYDSPDGEEGYPGSLAAQGDLQPHRPNELKMDYSATTDKPTVVNLTNHAYWNLAGRGAATFWATNSTLNADRYLPADDALMPTGEMKAVAGTPMDFTQPKTVGSRIAQVKGGYDHCYVLNKAKAKVRSEQCRRWRPASSSRQRPRDGGLHDRAGRPALHGQLPGRFADAGGVAYGQHAGLCLETQHYPDSPNHPDVPLDVAQAGRDATIS